MAKRKSTSAAERDASRSTSGRGSGKGSRKAPKGRSGAAAEVVEPELVLDEEADAEPDSDSGSDADEDLDAHLEPDEHDLTGDDDLHADWDLDADAGDHDGAHGAPNGDTDGESSGHSPAPAHFRSSLPRPYRSGRGAVGYQDPLQLYLREISAFPLLKPDEELEFARRVRESGDSEAAFRLVSSHLRLVVKIAMDFQRRWMQNVLDLIQEGNVGLMRAVQKFDPEKGIKFSYYAAFWIKAYILKFIMDNWRLVKIGTTQAQRKLFYNLNKERQRLKTMGYDADAATISRNLGVSEEQVREMEQRLDGSDMSLNINVGEDSTATRMDFLPALGPGIEETLADHEMARTVREHLESIVPTLSDKEVDILEGRLLSDQPVTLREIGEKYGITRERVRQLETRLLKKLRDHLSREIGDFSRDWIERED